MFGRMEAQLADERDKSFIVRRSHVALLRIFAGENALGDRSDCVQNT
jgi:hypothetical protein